MFQLLFEPVSAFLTRHIRHTIIGLCIGLCLTFGAPALALDPGTGKLTINANGTAIDVYTYHPPDCQKPSLLFVFHGLKRKAESLRNKAMTAAREACLVVFAPHFDKTRFPNWRYHRAGVVRKGRIQPESKWTAPILHALLALGRNQVGDINTPLYLFGHSAGGQFLSRIAAYSPPKGVDRIIVANPSVYVAPLIDEAAPYGFDGVFSSAEKLKKRIKAYLALPITIYVGQEDIGDKYLVKDKAAMRQGKNRLTRGRNIFRLAKGIAAHENWPFNWRLVEASGVGHSSGGMLRSPAFMRAIGLPVSERVDNVTTLLSSVLFSQPGV